MFISILGIKIKVLRNFNNLLIRKADITELWMFFEVVRV